MTWRPRMLLPPGTCKIAGPKVYWTQSLGAYCQVLRIYQVFSRDEVNQLDKDISEFGQNTAGTAFTQFARYSPIPNQSTGLSNEGFIWPFLFVIKSASSFDHCWLAYLEYLNRLLELKKRYPIELFNSFFARLRSANAHLFVERSSEDHD